MHAMISCPVLCCVDENNNFFNLTVEIEAGYMQKIIV